LNEFYGFNGGYNELVFMDVNGVYKLTFTSLVFPILQQFSFLKGNENWDDDLQSPASGQMKIPPIASRPHYGLIVYKGNSPTI
jgi:hypothetical protein